MLLVWQIAALSQPGFPSPYATWQAAQVLFADPFYSNGPNDQGIGWNVLASLQRVGIGFGLAALVGIPAGFLIGRFTFMARMFNPAYRPSAAGQSAGLAADWPAAVSARRAGRQLDHFHLFHLADDHQHRRRGTADSAGLPQRCAGVTAL